MFLYFSILFIVIGVGFLLYYHKNKKSDKDDFYYMIISAIKDYPQDWIIDRVSDNFYSIYNTKLNVTFTLGLRVIIRYGNAYQYYSRDKNSNNIVIAFVRERKEQLKHAKTKKLAEDIVSNYSILDVS